MTEDSQKSRRIENPFAMPQYGPDVATLNAADRIEMVKKFNASRCRAALKLPGLQVTVRQAIERRLRALGKEKGE